MATVKKRVAAYLPPHVEERFNAFKAENGLDNDSKAIIHILASFFGVAHLGSLEVAHSSQYATVERVEVIETKVSELLKLISESHSKIHSKIEDAVSEVKSELISELQSGSPVSIHSSQLGLLPNGEDSNYELPEKLLDGLRLKELSARLNRHRDTVADHRRRGMDHFRIWSREQDPDGIAWNYRRSRYYPSI